MPGLEVIGSLLATFTLVVNLLHSYKDSEINQDWDLLLECFKTEELIFLEYIQYLIAENVSESDLRLLSSRKDAIEFPWNDMQSFVTRCLGQEKISTFFLTLLDMDKLIKAMGSLPAHETISDKGNGLGDFNKQMVTPQMGTGKFHDGLVKLREYNGHLGKLILGDEKLTIPTTGIPLSSSSNLAPTKPQQPQVSTEDIHAPQQASYEYRELDFDKHEIRLLLLDMTEDEDAPIMCSLKNESLLEPDPYAALSYCWGDPSKRTTMHIKSANGRHLYTMDITINLDAALRAVRKYLRDKWSEWSTETSPRLWVDAVCINQTDRKERSLQVRNMRQIYTGAQEVIAWVGPLESERFSDEDLVHLSNASLWCSLLDHQSGDIAQAIQLILKDSPVARKKELQAFNAFFGFQYWTRVWIIQEITVPTTVRILYGNLDFLWEDLVKLLSVLETAAKQNQVLDGRSFQGSMYLSKFYEHSLIKRRPISLLEALSWSRRSHSTDPRDKIFALLGLCYDGLNFVPLPNYKQPLESIIADMSKKMIHLNRSLDIIGLRGIGARKGKSSMSTWASDWPTIWRGGMTIQESRLMQSPSSFSFSPILEDSNRLLLKVIGRPYCTVTHITTTMWPYGYTISGVEHQQSKSLHRKTPDVACTVDLVFRDKIWQTLTISLQGQSVPGFDPTLGSKWFSQLWLPAGRSSIENVTLIDWLDENAGFKIRGHTLLQWSQMSGTGKEEGSEAATGQFSQTVSILNKALEDILGSGMRLACLEQGGQVDICMIHPNAQQSDKIFDLKGCSIPLVLRKKATGSQGDSYTVIGGAWMDRTFESPSAVGINSHFQTLVLI